MSFDAELRDVLDLTATSRQPNPPLRHPNAPFHCMPPSMLPTATRNPYVKALTCAGVTYLVATALALGVILLPTLAHQASHQLGDAIAGAMVFFFLPAIAPGLATGLIVSLSPGAWRLRRIAALFFPLFLLAVALQALGAAPW